MGIWERLGNVVKSYINDEDERVFHGSASKRHADPDLNAAYEELDDFLRGGNDAGEKPKDGRSERGASGETAGKRERPVPSELRQDFAELGLSPDASAGECKAAYKKLLKVHHPDRHAGNPENMKKATEKTARINEAYKRLERWFSSAP